MAKAYAHEARVGRLRPRVSYSITGGCGKRKRWLSVGLLCWLLDANPIIGVMIREQEQNTKRKMEIGPHGGQDELFLTENKHTVDGKSAGLTRRPDIIVLSDSKP